MSNGTRTSEHHRKNPFFVVLQFYGKDCLAVLGDSQIKTIANLCPVRRPNEYFSLWHLSPFTSRAALREMRPVTCMVASIIFFLSCHKRCYLGRIPTLNKSLLFFLPSSSSSAIKGECLARSFQQRYLRRYTRDGKVICLVDVWNREFFFFSFFRLTLTHLPKNELEII